MRALMSALLPAPSMIVVLSLSMMIFLARPRSVIVRFSSFDAQALKDGCAAGEDGDILEHRLAAIAVTGSLDRRST